MSEEIKKNKGGRPLKFKSAQEILDKAQEYFDANSVINYTLTGLCLHLNTFKDVLDDYQSGKYDDKDPEYSNSVKRIKLFIENSYEISLKGNNVAGCIFALKNFGWKDKTEQEINQKSQITFNEEKTYEAVNKADESS